MPFGRAGLQLFLSPAVGCCSNCSRRLSRGQGKADDEKRKRQRWIYHCHCPQKHVPLGMESEGWEGFGGWEWEEEKKRRGGGVVVVEVNPRWRGDGQICLWPGLWALLAMDGTDGHSL
jgi:hypothetical protein